MKISKSALFLLYLTTILCIACQNENSNGKQNENFIADTIPIFNYFDQKAFTNDTMMLLLQELGICVHPENYTDTTQLLCSARNYAFFKYNESLPLNDAFGLEIRAGVDNFKLRRFILFQRIGGKLVKMRGFVANLAEMHTKPNGYNDLLLLFPDKEAGSFVVKYTWDAEDDIYQFESLEAIDGYTVKENKKDSLSNVVLNRLAENNMFF